MALPEMQHASDAKHCRNCGHAYVYEAVYLGHLGRYRCPNCGRTPPGPRRRRRATSTLHGHAGRRVHPAHAGGLGAPSRSPSPASTTSTTRSGPPRSRCALGVALATIVGGARGRLARLRPGRDRRARRAELTILLVKNPAGANEVLRTLALEPGRARPARRAQRQHRPTAGTSPGSGTPTSSCSPTRVRRVTCAGTRAGRAGAAAEVRGRAGRAPRRRARAGGGARRGPPADGDRPLFALPTYTAMLDAAGAAPSAASADRVLERRAERRRSGTTSSAAPTPPTSRSGASWPTASGGPVLDVGAGTGRVTLDLARGGVAVIALDRDPVLLAALRERAGRGAGRDRGRPTRATSPSTARSRSSSRRCRRVQLLGGPEGRGRVPAPRRRPPRPRRPASLSRWPPRSSPWSPDVPPAPSRHARARRPGAVLPADPRDRGGRAAGSSSASASRGRAGRAHREPDDQIASTASPPTTSSARATAVGLAAAGAAPRSPTTDEHVGSDGGDPGPCLSRTLRVCALYPELMNIYADRGNLLLLERRCAWRGIGFELSGAHARRAARPGAADLYLHRRRPGPRPAAVRAGPRRAQARRAARGRRPRRRSSSPCAAATSSSASSYVLGDEELPGAGLVDLRTVREEGPRLIGNVAIEVELGRAAPRVLAGFENHGGRTHLGPGEAPLGRVLSGHGNNGEDGFEGVRGGRRQRHRHLPPRAAAAQERLVRGLADRRRAGVRPISPRSTTTLEDARARARPVPRAGRWVRLPHRAQRAGCPREQRPTPPSPRGRRPIRARPRSSSAPLTKRYPGLEQPAVDELSLDGPGRRGLRARRPVGLRQDHRACGWSTG